MKPSKSTLVPQKPFTRKRLAILTNSHIDTRLSTNACDAAYRSRPTSKGNVAKKLLIDDKAEEDDGGSSGGAPSVDQQRCPFYVSPLSQRLSLYTLANMLMFLSNQSCSPVLYICSHTFAHEQTESWSAKLPWAFLIYRPKDGYRHMHPTFFFLVSLWNRWFLCSFPIKLAAA